MPSNLGQPPYKVYRSGPKGLRARLRGEEDELVQAPGPDADYRRYSARRGFRGLFRRGDPDGIPGTEPRKKVTPGRVIKWLVLAVVAWLVISLAAFIISAQTQQGTLPASAKAALTGGGNMVFSTDTILIMGTDQRPRTGPGSKEPGSNYNDAGSRTDTLMLWRVGAGTSRRLSIPRDTAVPIPGHGIGKINAAYALGGPALTIKTVEAFTGIKINHAIIVNLADFVPFINALGGIDVKTEHVCAQVSGGPSHGGFALNLSRGVHHLNGLQALLYSRIRENPCNPADSDLTRVQHQQQVLNAIKSRLLSPSTFIRLPIASWDAPKVLRSDMGGLTLMSLFIAAEIGGSAPVHVLKPSGGEYLPGYGDALTVNPGAVHTAVNQLMNG